MKLLSWAQHGLQTNCPFVFFRSHGALRQNLNSPPFTQIQSFLHFPSQHKTTIQPAVWSPYPTTIANHQPCQFLSSKYLLNSSRSLYLCFHGQSHTWLQWALALLPSWATSAIKKHLKLWFLNHNFFGINHNFFGIKTNVIQTWFIIICSSLLYLF